jgi:CxxC-x17-CxxC domain-containing protein
MGYTNTDVPAKDRFGRTLYDGVCVECHRKCQVPFRPDPKKELRCSECHQIMRESRVPRDLNPHPSSILKTPAPSGT